MHEAAWQGRVDIMCTLLSLEYGDEDGNPVLLFDPSSPGPGGITPLHMASAGGHIAAVRLLLEDPRYV